VYLVRREVDMSERWADPQGETPGFCNVHKHTILSTCDDCDRERENPVYYRGMRVSVYVDRDWLTNDGDEESEEGGWEELQSQLEKGINGIMRYHGVAVKGVWVCWEEWEGDPEVETNAWVLREFERRQR
tara:strand:+ start:358 stop:747 length:390 start_codon:yes stop_codon:yes gene_type:complete